MPDPCLNVPGCHPRAEPQEPSALSPSGQMSETQSPRAALAAASAWLVDGRCLPCLPSELLCILVASGCKNNMILTSLPLQDVSSKYGYFLRSWRSDLEHVNQEDTVQPKAPHGSSYCYYFVSGRVCVRVHAHVCWRWNPGPRVHGAHPQSCALAFPGHQQTGFWPGGRPRELCVISFLSPKYLTRKT